MGAKVALADKFAGFSETWAPRIVSRYEGHEVRIARLDGEFHWHAHDHDELFLCLEGTLDVEFRDRTETLEPGELLLIEKGAEHRPVALVVEHAVHGGRLEGGEGGASPRRHRAGAEDRGVDLGDRRSPSTLEQAGDHGLADDQVGDQRAHVPVTTGRGFGPVVVADCGEGLAEQGGRLPVVTEQVTVGVYLHAPIPIRWCRAASR